VHIGLTTRYWSMYRIHMKTFKWNKDKNETLKQKRGVCFEDVFISIKEGGLLDTVKHPNSKTYPNQFIYIVRIQGYAYMVPFVVEADYIFLKTIIPSRKHTKKYIKDD
jgi:uncharacterized DUF497 family protein